MTVSLCLEYTEIICLKDVIVVFFFNKFTYLFYFWLHWDFVAVRGLLTAVASLVAEHRL